MKHKAQKINSEEWIEGYLCSKKTINRIIDFGNGNIGLSKEIIKPETLQVQITSTGEWRNVDEVEVVRKNKVIRLKEVCNRFFDMIHNSDNVEYHIEANDLLDEFNH